MSGDDAAPHGWLRRLSVRAVAAARHYWLLALFLCAGCTAILATGASAVWFATQRGAAGSQPTLTEALENLDAGQIDTARRMAKRLQLSGRLSHQQLGGPVYIQGAALAREAAEREDEGERRKLYLIAARYLEVARDRGFPPGREAQGTYLLSTCLFHSGHYAESLPWLIEALPINPLHRHELHRRLAAAYFRDGAPQLKQALHYSHLGLQDPNLTVKQRDEELLQQANIYWQLNRLPEAERALSQCSEASAMQPHIMLTRACILLARGDQRQSEQEDDSRNGPNSANASYRAAIGQLQQAQALDNNGSILQQCRYLTGLGHLKLGNPRAAEHAFQRTRQLHSGTPEAVAAALFEAEIQQQQGRHLAALATYSEALAAIDNPQTYQNPWVTFNAFCDRLLAAQREFRDSGHFEQAIELSHLAHESLSRDEMLQAEAQGRQAWAESLQRRSNAERIGVAAVTRAEARSQYRRAGDLYQRLAERRFATQHYPHDLWESGSCFLRGQNYHGAVEALYGYLQNCARKDMPQGLVALGEAHLSTGNLDASQRALHQCIELFPRHPWSYRARILASRVCREKGNVAEAKRILLENLDHESLTPESQEWIDSQFAFGQLLYVEALSHERAGRKVLLSLDASEETSAALLQLEQADDLFERAIRAFQEARQRAPDHPLAAESRYRIAEARRHRARNIRTRIQTEPTALPGNLLAQQARDELNRALADYQKLQKELSSRMDPSELTEVESSILRNSCFASADTLFDLDRLDEAIDAYWSAISRYRHQPESLEAFMQIAACQQRLQRGLDAQGTIAQAATALTSLPADVDFQRTTRYTRKQWVELLGWLSTL
jgi:TolA-binding protein